MREIYLRYRRVSPGFSATLFRAGIVLIVVTLLSAVTLQASPTVGSVNPAIGGPGTMVTIYGSEFGLNVVGLIPYVTGVKFGGVDAQYTLVSPTQIRATVPPNATTGAIRISFTIFGAVTSQMMFTVPTAVTSFAPTTGIAGAAVTISGTNLGEATAVNFNGKTATFTRNATGQLVATVPTGATSGPINVTTIGPNNATAAGTSGAQFQVLSACIITGFLNPANGYSTTTGYNKLAVVGQHFAGATAVSVRNNGNWKVTPMYAFNVDSDGQISVTTPDGMEHNPTSYSVLVTTAAGICVSEVSLHF